MPKRVKSQHSFLAGEWSPKLYSRSDIQNYSEAVKTHTNRYTDALGPSVKRNGTVYIQDINDETRRPRAWEFTDDDGDNVVLEFGHNYVVAYENKVAVGSPLTTTYSESEVENLSIAQYKNEIYCAVAGKNLRKITYNGGGSMSIADVTWSTAPATTQPDLVFLYQQRLGVVNSSSLLIEFSESGDLDDFTTGSAPDKAFSINLAITGSSTIKAVSVTRHLVIHTTTGEITIEGTGSAGYIGPPADYRIERRQTKGTNSNRTFVTGQEVLFVGRDGKSLNRFFYNYEIDAYDATTLSDFASHLFTSQIKDISYSEISRRIFVVLDGGELLCGTYVKERRVMAWSKFVFDGVVESVAVSQDADNNENVYLFIRRTINGSTARYVEIFDTGDGTNIQDSFLDASKTFGTTVSGATLYKVAKVKSGTLYTGGTTISSIVKGAGRTKLTLGASVTGTFDVGDTLIITGTTGTGDLPDTLNGTHTIESIVSGTEVWIATDVNGPTGTITAGTGSIYVHANVTVIVDTSHSLNTNDIVQITATGTTDFNGPRTITKQGANHWTIAEGSFTVNDINTSYAISYNPQVTSVSGLSHLEGETVRVKLDGSDIGNHTVTSGAITLSSPGYLGVVGLSYTATLTTMPTELGGAMSSTLGAPAVRASTLIHVVNSMSPIINNNQAAIRRYQDQLDTSLNTFTGYLDYGPSKWSESGSITITDTSPHPSMITGIFGSVVSNTR